MFYFDNRKKYVLENGQRDKTLLKSDLIKIISSLGIGEVVYTIVRWSLQYYLLLINYEPYMASIVSHIISTGVYMITLNLSVKLTKLYKDGSLAFYVDGAGGKNLVMDFSLKKQVSLSMKLNQD